MADLTLDSGDAATLQGGDSVTLAVGVGVEVIVGPGQVNEQQWAVLDAGGTVMVLAEVVGQNVMAETHVTT